MSSTDPSPASLPSSEPGSSKEEQNVEKKQQKEETKLAPLKGTEFRAYNRLAEHMDLYHAHFRTTWNSLWAEACAGNSNGGKAKLRRIMLDGFSFVGQLETHHQIEEAYIFPVLARRMPEFKNDGKGAAELLRQHREIHHGLDELRNYLQACRQGSKELDMDVMKALMETWGTVLWTHMDQEVKTLGAENMRKYWTAEEIRQIPM